MAEWVPDRLTLQNMEKKSTKSFKEYAQRWRDMASQVQPPLIEKETTMLFMSTLRPPCYNKLVGNATKNFIDLVISGEMIETAIKAGKIMTGECSTRKKPGIGKKKEEARSINYASQPYHWTVLPKPKTTKPKFLLF